MLLSFCTPLTSELSAALKVAEVDLAAARNHIQQFKEISQASEEALASLNTTHDEYKSSTEAQIATSWVCPVPDCARFFVLTGVLLPIGPTRSASEQSYERPTRARADQNGPSGNETCVRECTRGMARGQEDPGGRSRGYDGFGEEPRRRQVDSRV